jgi:tape measure domain-containing protein
MEGGWYMATIQQSIDITDGVTPQFQKMAKAAEATTGKFERAAAAANRIENAVSATTATHVQGIGTAAHSAATGLNVASTAANKVGTSISRTTVVQIQDIDAAARSTATGLDMASSSAGNLKNNINNISGGFGKIREVMASTFGKFTLASIAIMAITQVVALLTQAAGKLTNLSDEYSGIVARIKLITASAEEAAAMNDQIYYSALRARGSYSGMADAVSKIGLTAKEAFPDPKAIVPFVENIQKLFTVGGTGIEQQKDAMLQLTQALGSGKLQGDEFRSIAEAAPMIEQIVARYMGVTQGELKQLSTDGQITAEIMKNAILGATDEINAKFADMPVTWGQIWQNMQTVAFRAFIPVFNQLSAIANSPAAKQFGETMERGFIAAGMAIAGIINNARWLAGVFQENEVVITPIVWGFVAVLAVANMSLIQAGISATVAAAASAAHAIASAGETAAILALILAQDGLNAAFAACPLTWILYGIVAVVVVFYLAVAAVNHFAGTSLSATGLIFGAFMWLFAGIWNIVAFTVNIFMAFAEFFVNVWKDPLAAVHNLFASIWNGIVDLVGKAISSIISMIKQIPGIDKVIGDYSFSPDSLKVGMTPIEDGWTAPRMKMLDGANEGTWGYGVGSNLRFENPFPKAPEAPAPFPVPAVPGVNADDVGKNTKDTADNTGKIKDAMEITDEDIKYLRDIAEQEVINKYTTAEVKIEMGGIHNSVSNDMDIDGMVRYINDSLFDAMTAGAEKVHP